MLGTAAMDCFLSRTNPLTSDGIVDTVGLHGLDSDYEARPTSLTNPKLTNILWVWLEGRN